MRDILFRGKRIDTGEWVIGSPLKLWVTDIISSTDTDDEFPCIETNDRLAYFIVKETHADYEFDDDNRVEVIPETVGQYTELKDKNGKEIYESQKVLITGEQELDYGMSFEWNELAIVRWSEKECGFYLDAINKREINICEDGYFTVDTFPLRQWDDGEWSIEYEVIEPELLQGTNTAAADAE